MSPKEAVAPTGRGLSAGSLAICEGGAAPSGGGFGSWACRQGPYSGFRSWAPVFAG